MKMLNQVRQYVRCEPDRIERQRCGHVANKDLNGDAEDVGDPSAAGVRDEIADEIADEDAGNQYCEPADERRQISRELAQ